MEIETQSLDAAGAIRARKLFEWEVTAAASPAPKALPERDVRLKREISVVFEPNAVSALATMTETIYETPGQGGAPTDSGYFAALNAKQTKTYHYVAVSAETAETANLATAISWFNNLAAVTSETDYLYDANYKARNITGLATEQRVLDPANGNAVVGKTQLSYDESNFSLTETGTMPSWATGSWTDPITELGSTIGTKRGLPTTVKSYYDIANSLYIQTHSFVDQYGNIKKARDGRGNESEMEYSADYAFAFPTKVKTPPPSDGTYGSTQPFETTSKQVSKSFKVSSFRVPPSGGFSPPHFARR